MNSGNCVTENSSLGFHSRCSNYSWFCSSFKKCFILFP